MSVIVAIKSDDKVYIGSDSQVTKGGTRATLKNPNNYKIWNVRDINHCLMAHVGAVRDANIVRLMDDLVTDYDVFMDKIDYEFVVRRIVPSIIAELKRAGYMKDDQYVEHMESSFLFAYKNQLFVINSDGCVLEVDDYVSIGSGEDQAIGSLLSTEKLNPKSRIIMAIKASAVSDIYVDYPIILTDTYSNKYELINETNEKTYLKGK